MFAELEVQWFPLGVEVAEEVVDIDDLRLQGYKYFFVPSLDIKGNKTKYFNGLKTVRRLLEYSLRTF